LPEDFCKNSGKIIHLLFIASNVERERGGSKVKGVYLYCTLKQKEELLEEGSTLFFGHRCKWRGWGRIIGGASLWFIGVCKYGQKKKNRKKKSKKKPANKHKIK
jgi:hypothetical protein